MKHPFLYIFVVLIGITVVTIIPHTAAAAVTQKVGTSTEGLVGWWTFDEGTSTIAHDFSGRGSVGVLTNFAAPATASSGWFANAKRGGGLNFDGNDDGINVSETTVNTNSFTISTWVKLSTTQQSRIFFGKHRIPQSNGIALGISDTTNNVVKLYTGNSSINDTLSSTVALTNGVWYHIVGTFDGTTKRLYINGVLNNSNTWVNTIDYTGTVTGIGYLRSGSLQYLNGSLDDMRVYNRALSAADVAKLYAAGSVKITTTSAADTLANGLVGWWTLDGKDTTWYSNTTGIVYDKSSTGNTGTLTGMTQAMSTTQGKIGQGLLFDGSATEIAVSNTNIPTGANQRTISVWFKMDPTATNNQSFFCYGVNVSGQRFNLLYINSGTTLGVETTNYARLFTWSRDTKWHNLVAVYPPGQTSTSQILLYLDGVLQASSDSGTPQTLNTGTGTAKIGNHNNVSSDHFRGTLDDVRVYNRALSATEIKRLYSVGSTNLAVSQPSKVNSGLVGYWSFNGKDISWSSASAGTALDRSGAGNNGTLSGFTQSKSPVSGKVGQGLIFSPANATLVTLSGISLGTVHTAMAWVKPNKQTVSFNFGGIMGDNSSNTGPLSISGTNDTDFAYTEGVSGVGYSGPSMTGQWHHIATVRNGQAVTLYLDGVQVGSGTLPGNSSITITKLGTRNGGLSFTGTLDEIRVYNRTLSASEIKQIYKMGI